MAPTDRIAVYKTPRGAAKWWKRPTGAAYKAERESWVEMCRALHREAARYNTHYHNHKVLPSYAWSRCSEDGDSADFEAYGTGNSSLRKPEVSAVQRIQEPFPILKLPFELQCKIWTEAIRKPNIHFIRAKKVINDTTNTWGLEILPVPKSTDTSGFRQQVELATICPSAKEAVYMANAEKQKLPFKLLKGIGDAATDVVAIKFESPKNVKKLLSVPRETWAPGWQVLNPALDADQVASVFAGIRRAAVKYSGPPSPDTMNSLFCRRYHFGCPEKFRACPDEVAGFVDCLPNVEILYFILDPGSPNASAGKYGRGARRFQKQAEEYLEFAFFNLTQQERMDMGVEVFHSTDGLYLELSRAVVTRCDPWAFHPPKTWEVRNRLQTGAGPFRKSLAQRQALQLKVLVPLGADLAAKMGIPI
ncbi:hypothetical protein B0H67DRAFT_650683 [Lasiosphaeris hirsuta]|uniref:Uncharacterized protein n=1 Tax=Lasiosphaeris hirsuta TaxID=260670 RepID=A0AA40B8E8_9PEZI|nr:hypothetical protein B0H67DRAFT_650683 [Lasiosphaeris hirsuta]